ncbi:MAG: hypothetical protein N2248_02655 [candidate division WOR-3 bacterium]|uniref:Uncharacterized protein n=1 Tax=candidate division WOR-3 bacterium TaxID=2052148 RepID=A0A7C1T0E3_UNCW3|nr:hypothetical protein [candidate division WOR-3 bacterium]
MELEKIEYEQSVLFRRVYRKRAALKRHIASLMGDGYDSMLVFKFTSHYSSINNVGYNIEFINSLLKELAKREGIEEYRPPVLIRFLYGDWFIEICTALGALGGISAFLTLLIELKKYRGIKKLKKRVKNYPIQVGGKIQIKQEVYIDEIIEENIGRINIAKILEYYDEDLQFIEIFTKDGEIIRYLWREKKPKE